MLAETKLAKKVHTCEHELEINSSEWFIRLRNIRLELLKTNRIVPVRMM